MAKCDDKKCPPGKICNPKSGRCVKKDGVIGKKILAEKKKKTSKPAVRCSRIRKSDCKKKAGCHWVVGKGCKKGKKPKPKPKPKPKTKPKPKPKTKTKPDKKSRKKSVKKLPDLADEIMMNINSLAGCKTLIKSLNKEQVKNYPWKFVNSKFHPVFGKMKYPNGRELFNQDLFLLAYLNGINPRMVRLALNCTRDQRMAVVPWRRECNRTILEVKSFLQKKGYTISLNIEEMRRLHNRSNCVRRVGRSNRDIQLLRLADQILNSDPLHKRNRNLYQRRFMRRYEPLRDFCHCPKKELSDLYIFNVWNVDYNLKPTICYGSKDCIEFYTKCHWLASMKKFKKDRVHPHWTSVLSAHLVGGPGMSYVYGSTAWWRGIGAARRAVHRRQNRVLPVDLQARFNKLYDKLDAGLDTRTRKALSPRRSRSNTYRWMSYASAAKHIPEAKEKGVSKVARGRSGFMGVYKRVGSSKNMDKESYTETQTWGRRRNAFIKRHMAQYKKNPTRRRWLALAMWAYKPPGTAPK